MLLRKIPRSGQDLVVVECSCRLLKDCSSFLLCSRQQPTGLGCPRREAAIPGIQPHLSLIAAETEAHHNFEGQEIQYPMYKKSWKSEPGPVRSNLRLGLRLGALRRCPGPIGVLV